jgi:hypothetical protein
MRKLLFLGVILTITSLSAIFLFQDRAQDDMNGAPPYGTAEDSVPSYGVLSWLDSWERPEGPAKVGLQVGHWKNEEFPDELEKLRGNSGASGGGKSEWEVNFAIAEKTAGILAEKGIKVDILPATIPPSYWADVFVAIHADGSPDSSKTGFKVAGPWRDYSGGGRELVDSLTKYYEKVSGFPWDDNITRNMRGYYAFSWWKYEHAIHPMAAAAIIETGFLTNATDRKILIDKPQIPAKGISQGIINYLELKGTLKENNFLPK